MKVKTKKGTTNIDHILLEKLARCEITGLQHRCIDVIIRWTIGFHRQHDWLTYRRLADLTGSSRQKCCAAVLDLINRKILTRAPVTARGKTRPGLGINPNRDEWQDRKMYPSRTTKQVSSAMDNVSHPGNIVYPSQATKTYPNQATPTMKDREKDNLKGIGAGVIGPSDGASAPSPLRDRDPQHARPERSRTAAKTFSGGPRKKSETLERTLELWNYWMRKQRGVDWDIEGYLQDHPDVNPGRFYYAALELMNNPDSIPADIKKHFDERLRMN